MSRCCSKLVILFYSVLLYSVVCPITAVSWLFYSILFYSILFYSILFYSILCPSIAGSSPQPVLQLSLPFAVLGHIVSCGLTMPSLQGHFGLPNVCTPFNIRFSVFPKVFLLFYYPGDVPRSSPLMLLERIQLCVSPWFFVC